MTFAAWRTSHLLSRGSFFGFHADRMKTTISARLACSTSRRAGRSAGVDILEFKDADGEIREVFAPRLIG